MTARHREFIRREFRSPSPKRKVLKFEAAQTLADKRQVVVAISSANPDRTGDIVMQEGIDTGPFMRIGGTTLWSHDPDAPIAKTVKIGVVDGRLTATAQFPPAGISPKADEVFGLIGAGVVNAASIGFSPVEFEPIDPKIPWGPQRYLKIELAEWSFVSVPANSDAAIIQRSLRDRAKPDLKSLVGALKGMREDVKAGRVLSEENLAHVAAIQRCLGAMSECIVRALDSHGQTHEDLQNFADHLNEGAARAKALLKAGAPNADDDETDDPEADVELSASAGRAKRMAEVKRAERRLEIQRLERKAHEELEANTWGVTNPQVPWNFRVIDPSRQVQAIIAHGAPNNAGDVCSVEGCDFDDFLKSAAVCWRHEVDKVIAWSIDLKRYANHIRATAQFPPPGVSKLADQIFEKIMQGEITEVSFGAMAVIEKRADGTQFMPRWKLTEWSMTTKAAHSRTRIVGLPRKAIAKRDRWDNEANPRMPTPEEAGPTQAHLAQALARYEVLKNNAYYFRSFLS